MAQKQTSTTTQPKQDYLVLARKYRPQNFSELVGQDALVTTLTNAIKQNKIHHAYVLTGIRGTGKTTTARIMAMALNCTDGPAAEWPADDPAAKNIAEGRHVDVLEFDAASHRKVEEIADLFEGVAYAPVEGRYKVYIIDEVHMLTKHAFNAILKTLEEPPANVKFIFATTEVNKIPVTVLSRCQRFDLKRVGSEELTKHYSAILEKEGVKADSAAVASIARAADGSVRDGLSLLDQAIALSGKEGITTDLVADMLGQADTARLYDLTDAFLKGEATEALAIVDDLYAHGQDATQALTDMLTLLHLMTRLKVVPTLKDSNTLTEIERTRAVPMAEKIPMENLARAYQMLAASARDIHTAERPFEALTMAMVRLTHLAALPPVAQLMKQAEAGDIRPPQAETPPAKKPDKTEKAAAAAPVEAAAIPPWEEDVPPADAPEPPVEKEKSQQNAKTAMPTTWEEVVRVVTAQRIGLGSALAQQVKPVEVAPPKLVLHIENGLTSAADISRELRVALTDMTGKAWEVTQVDAPPENSETLHQTKERTKAEDIAALKETPAMKQVLATFPDAELVDVV